MIKSMTGYGECSSQSDYVDIYVEIKSLNSRFFDFHSKTCKILSVFDNEVKNKIKMNCVRGSFQLITNIKFNNTNKMIINENKVKDYIDVSNQIQLISNNNLGPLTIDKLINIPDIYNDQEKDSKLIKELYLNCIDDAIVELNKSRNSEGENIACSLNQNIIEIDKSLEKILKLYKKNIDNQFNIYKNKINEILEDSVIDENRLYQEIAIIIEKRDINEELVRLESHLSILKKYLNQDGNAGKKINFMLQEIGREINTISSKSSDIKIIHETLNMKNQVEQIREQVQNIL